MRCTRDRQMTCKCGSLALLVTVTYSLVVTGLLGQVTVKETRQVYRRLIMCNRTNGKARSRRFELPNCRGQIAYTSLDMCQQMANSCGGVEPRADPK
jgi:hypothetical protein